MKKMAYTMIAGFFMITHSAKLEAGGRIFPQPPVVQQVMQINLNNSNFPINIRSIRGNQQENVLMGPILETQHGERFVLLSVHTTLPNNVSIGDMLHTSQVNMHLTQSVMVDGQRICTYAWNENGRIISMTARQLLN